MASSGSKDGQLQIKVVLLGAASVGKTCLVSRYVHDRFTSNYQNVSGLFINNFVKYLWYIRDMLFMSLGTSFTCCSRRSLCMLTMEIGPVSSMLKLLIKLMIWYMESGLCMFPSGVIQCLRGRSVVCAFNDCECWRG